MKKANADKMIRQVKKILIYIIVVNIFGIIALLTFLYVLSPGKIESFKDKTGVDFLDEGFIVEKSVAAERNLS